MISKRLILIALFVLAGSIPRASAQAPADKVKRRQADLLYPIGSLVQSSKTQGDPEFIVGVLGAAPFSGKDAAGNGVNHLNAAAVTSNDRRETTNRKRIALRRFKAGDAYKQCHILFVSKGQLNNALQIAAKHRNTSPVLLIGNDKGLAEAGVPINFYEVIMPNGAISVRLEFNPAAARAAGFDKINPRLLGLLNRGLGRIVSAK